VATVAGTVLDPADAAWLRRVLPGRRITAAEPLGGGGGRAGLNDLMKALEPAQIELFHHFPDTSQKHSRFCLPVHRS